MLISKPIPNLIKQPAQCCIYCGKSFKTKTKLNKHVILCELIVESKKHKNTDKDSDIDIPSTEKIYTMLLELGYRHTILENKVQELNKYVIKTKKQVNVIEWLNTNITPEIQFNKLIDNITINNDMIDYLTDNTILKTFQTIFEKSLNMNTNTNPLFASIHKSNHLYIYENTDTKWIELSKELFVRVLNKIHSKLIRANVSFKSTHEKKRNEDESFALVCDRNTLKIMDIDFDFKSSFVTKLKSFLYSKLKTEIENVIEYELT